MHGSMRQGLVAALMSLALAEVVPPSSCTLTMWRYNNRSLRVPAIELSGVEVSGSVHDRLLTSDKRSVSRDTQKSGSQSSCSGRLRIRR